MPRKPNPSPLNARYVVKIAEDFYAFTVVTGWFHFSDFKYNPKTRKISVPKMVCNDGVKRPICSTARGLGRPYAILQDQLDALIEQGEYTTP